MQIKNYFFTGLLALSLSILGIGCGEDSASGPGSDPELSVSVSSLNFLNNDAEKTFNITNSGVGTLEWSITDNKDWLSVSPSSGTTTTETDNIHVTVNTTDLASSTYNGTIIVTPTIGDAKTITVGLTVSNPIPVLSVSTSSLDFGSDNTDMSFNITNSGSGTLEWSIMDNKDWLSVNPESGTTTTETDNIHVTVNRTDLDNGSYSGVVVVTPTVGDSKTITVNITVTSPVLSISRSSIDFGAQETEMTFSISNSGGGSLIWELNEDASWLLVSPTSGSTTSIPTVVTVGVNRDNTENGSYNETIEVSSNAGNANIYVTMEAGELIWSYTITTNTSLDSKWSCGDNNDDWFSGDDYWGVVNSDPPGGSKAVWCAGRGDHTAGIYANNMEAWMTLNSGYAVNIRDYSDITVRFWMKYEAESNYDYMTFLVQGTDDSWYYTDNTRWTGSDFTWRQYEVSLSSFQHMSSNSLRIGFLFESGAADCFRGAFIGNIEIWGR